MQTSLRRFTAAASAIAACLLSASSPAHVELSGLAFAGQSAVVRFTIGHVADWAPEIRGQVLSCTMPPREAASPITREERERILQWIRCGSPE